MNLLKDKRLKEQRFCKVFFATLLIISNIHFSNAQSVDQILQVFKKSSHTFQNTTLPYSIAYPVNYDPNITYPVVLCLHGAGERGTENDKPIRKHSMATTWAKYSNQLKNPCIVIVPQCPKAKKWNYVDWGKGSFNIDEIEVGNELLTAIDLLDSLIDELNIDKNRQYVTGLSMGGYGTWDVVTRYPNRFAAAVPMSGAGDPSKITNLKNTPIWNFHNTQDQIVPVEGSRKMIDAMKKAGLKVIETPDMSDKALDKQLKKNVKYLYTETEEGNHGPWEPWYENPKLHEWMFSQTKNDDI
ncbi:MAG: prolyl oligopeptidase family serine peptidase [Reichenbachiella sp.]